MNHQQISARDFQKSMLPKLESIFSGEEVKTEWRAMPDEPSLYCPRLDIAVGPFAYNDQQFSQHYNEMMEHSRLLIDRLLCFHRHNVETLSWENCQISYDDLLYKNVKARCFMAVEIENEVSRKHLIGGLVNAAALGRIGIVIAWTDEKLNAFIRLRRYLDFLGSVGKNTFDTRNLIILKAEQLSRAVEEELHRVGI